MKQTVEFAYEIGEHVVISEPGYPGTVIEQQHTREGQYFNVMYWVDGNRRSDIFAEWELHQ